VAPAHEAVAVYLRIADTLRQRITAGELAPGSMLPSESALARDFGVARGTVRQALAMLEEGGLVTTQPGRGRWVGDGAMHPVQGHTRHEQVAEEIRSAIRGGQFKPGDRLPGENPLAERYGTARVTVRRALETLKREGLVTVVPRKGHYIAGGRKRSSKAATPRKAP
jgi:DNA-binding GntR family transcriptional regulator